MLASGRLSASTVPACRRSINRPASHRHPCPAAPAVLVSPSPTPIPQRNATGRRLDSTSPNLTPRLNPHRARGTDGAPTSRDFVPRRFSDAGLRACGRPRHRRRPKTCTLADIAKRSRSIQISAVESQQPSPSFLSGFRAKRTLMSKVTERGGGAALGPTAAALHLRESVSLAPGSRPTCKSNLPLGLSGEKDVDVEGNGEG